MVQISHSNYKSNTGVWILFFLCAVLPILLAGCSSQEKRWESPALVQPSDAGNEPEPAISTPETEAPVVLQPIDRTPAKSQYPYLDALTQRAGFQTAWFIASSAGLSSNGVEAKAEEYGVTQIQLGGDILQAVDDLILNPEKRNYVQRFAQQMNAENIEVLVNSREIHLEGRTFLFDKEAPLVAARQAAYRKALTLIPELDGVVLTFSGALLPPWDAAAPEGMTQISVPERIRFLIDTIRPVVVDELGKRLYVRLEGDTPQQVEWIAAALSEYNDDNLVVILPPADSSNLASLYGRFAGKPHMVNLDLTGAQFGGPRILASLGDRFEDWKALRNQDAVRGAVVQVYGKTGSALNSPNEINLYLFSKTGDAVSPDRKSVESEWIQKRYGFDPMTREESLMAAIFDRSAAVNKKMALVNNSLRFAVNGNLPDPESWNLQDLGTQSGAMTPEQEHFHRQLINPEKQTLIDLDQESYEAVDSINKSLADLESMRQQLHENDYNDLLQRLQLQRLLAEIFQYGKQSVWGFTLWKKTRDEDEALFLEAHLQKMEQLASALEERYGANVEPGNPTRIRKWVERIRKEFPRVIMGWKERTWNQIKDVVIQQTGPGNVEIRWNTTQPAKSNFFITSQLPIFDRMISSAAYPTTTHKTALSDLEGGKTYFIKIQVVSDNGQVTNSGIFPLLLETAPVM